MTDLELKRQLRGLARTALMLETELRHGRVDEGLINDIEQRMEAGIAIDPRCGSLRGAVDTLRESTLTPRPELLGDTIRASEQLRDAIDVIVAHL